MSVDFAVVICAYDEGRWAKLCEAVRSVKRQTLAPREVVVVVDHNEALLARARRDLEGVRVIENCKAKGLGGARNSGVEAATASYVAFLDDDATASERWLEFLAGSYKDLDVAGVGGSTRAVWEAGRPNWFPYEFEWVVSGAYRGMPLVRHEVRNLWGLNMSFRRELVLALGGFRIGPYCDDTEFCIRLRQRWPKKRFIFVPEARVLHHIDRSRTTVRRFLSRCYFEGGSKAVLSRLVGAQDALDSERRYTREVLPSGLRRGVSDFVYGADPAGLARAGLIVAGLASAIAGYGVGQLAPTRAATKRGLEERPIRTRRPSANPSGSRQRFASPSFGVSSGRIGRRAGAAPLRLVMATARYLPFIGGVERHVDEVARRLAARGLDVTILTTDPTGALPATEEVDGAHVRRVRAWPADRDYYFAPGVYRVLVQEDWDVVHVQAYHTFVAPLAMLAALRSGVPYVVTFHAGGHRSHLRHALRPVQLQVLRPLLARADRLIVNAPFEIEYYSRRLRVARERFALVPNGSDLPPPASSGRSSHSGTLVASLGRLERYKGHQRALAALPHIMRVRRDARLWIGGTGPYEAELRKLAAALDVTDHVDIHAVPLEERAGFADELARVGVVLLMSEFETQPMTALEALALGCRLIVADTPGLSALANDGLARPVPLDISPEELARVVVEELDKPPIAKPPSLRTWDECADSLLEVYASVAPSRSVP